MKKFYVLVGVVIISILVFCIGCQRYKEINTQLDKHGLSEENNAGSKINNQEKIDDKILGEGRVNVFELGECVLELKMYDGVYYNDKNLGSFQGDNWHGDCKLILTKNDQIISEYILDDWIEKMSFGEEFNILTYDYDGDGQFEFLIGQYFSSNINEYRLYRINTDKKIVNIEEVNYINISGKPRYSCLFDIEENGDIYYELYDNSKGKNVKKKLIFKDGIVTKEIL